MPFLGSKYAKIAIAAPLGELTALPRPLAGLRGPTSKGRGERRERGAGRGEKRREGEGREKLRPLCQIPGSAPVKGSKNKKNEQNKEKVAKMKYCKISQTQQDRTFGTQSTNDIIGYGELTQKIRFFITYPHRRQLKIEQ